MHSTARDAPVSAESIRLTLIASARNMPLRIRPAVLLTDDELYEMCRANRDLRVERTAQGELLIMPPTGGKTGQRNLRLAAQLSVWAEQDGTGVAFDSSTGFLLPNGAERSPDASWIRHARWDALTPEQQERFPPLCPDFVLELRSPSDALEDLRAKMEEYRDNGASLGWLIDPYAKRVEVYRPDEVVELLDAPSQLAGDPVLPGFVLRLAAIW
jgi:Uma2 family endonuclease